MTKTSTSNPDPSRTPVQLPVPRSPHATAKSGRLRDGGGLCDFGGGGRLAAAVFLGAAVALSLASCEGGGGGSLSETENTLPGANAFIVSEIADIDLSVEGAEFNEDDAAGATVGLTAFASDEDATENEVRYALTDDAGERFVIDSETGVVTLARTVALSEGNQRITVTASSIDGSNSSARFTIRVRPSDRFDVTVPVDTDLADNTVDITASVDTAVGITANAVDADVSGSTVSYSLSDDAGARFAIDEQTGVVTVARSLADDTASEYTIEVTATSEDSSTASARFTITAALGTRPVVSIDFPLPQSVAGAATLTIRGRVRFAEGAQLGSLTATIGTGTAQTITVDPGNTWSWQASLVENVANEIAFTLSDNTRTPATDDNSTTITITVTHYAETDETPTAVAMSDMRGLTLDAAGTKAYVVDTGLPGLYEVDLITGLNKVFSVGDADVSDGDSSVGTGTPFSDDLEGGIAHDAAGNRLIVSDDGNNNIIAVSLAAATLGNRTVLSGTSQTGSELSAPFGVAVDATGNRAFVADTAARGIIAVDLSTGNRTLISSAVEPATGAGPALTSPRDLVWDSANSRLLVIGTNPDELVAVDVATGNRAVIEAPEDNSIDFATVRSLAFDSASNLVYVAEFAGFEGIASVVTGSAGTGTRSIVSNLTTGEGPVFTAARGVVFDSINQRLLVTDSNLEALVAVDLDSGDRSLVEPQSALPSIGSGTALTSPVGVVFDPSANRLYVADDGTDAIVSVSLNDGNRTVIADGSSAGDTLAQPRGLAWNADNSALLVPDNTIDGIVSVDPQSGAGTVLASNTVGTALNSAPTFGSPRGQIAAESGTSILVADPSGSRDVMFRVNTTTGDRQALAVSTTNLAGIQTIVIDTNSSPARALAASGAAAAGTLDLIVAVDLTNGGLSVVSGTTLEGSNGTGTELADPRALALRPGSNTLLVLDVGLDALLEVALDAANTGNRTVLADNETGAGDFLDGFDSASGLTIDEERNVVYTVSQSFGGVVMIDLTTGDQVIVSR
ncbi:MAG: cadherin domain-containing protein [Gammaproteobacteria bacterium]|nr:cadherin domain-containing protein [Gammaproteobacteria bacterium]